MTMCRIFLMEIFLFTVFCYVLAGSKADSGETFVCKRAEDEGFSDRESDHEHMMRQLERKIEELEEKITLMHEISAVAPDVISLTYNTIPRDCAQLYHDGVRTDGVYQISPDGRCPFDVYCDMTNGGWTTIQRRQFADLDFRRTWDEYASGFGDLEHDFWLGLDKIHRLTQDGSNIKFLLGLYGKRNKTARAMYGGFIVHDVISGYAMNVDAFGYNGSIPELFSHHDGARFSTFDRDQDMYSSSCSEEMGGGGGWWYTSCYRLGVFNGVYGDKVRGGNAYWDTKIRFVKTTEIQIKPINGLC